MKKQHLSRLSAILLFLSLILGIMPQNAFLAKAATVDQTEQLVLRAEDVPEYFTLADMQNAGHVKRADRNDVAHLNEIEFQNADGTNTVYAFNENVRYVTASGDYKDKSNRLERSSDGSYSNPQNDIRVNYPEKIGQGVTVTRDTFSLTMIPEYTNNSPVAQTAGKEQSVYYPKAFGSNTVLQYTQTFNGFKEDIILISAPESNQFRFTLATNGATLSMDGDRLLVSDDGEEVGCFEPIYIYDSAGNSCYGSMQMLASSAARNTYSVIITAPWDFLTDTDTVYPVNVDPTLTLFDSSSSVIQDANVFTNYNQNYGSNATMSIGDFSQYPGDEPRGIGYGLVKFPFLTGNSTFMGYYNAGRVTDIDYFFAVTDCVTQTTLQAKRIGTAWTETGVTYSTVSAYISGTGTAYTKTIDATSSPQYYCFDLLPMINTTTNYNNMATKGLVLSTVPTSMPALTMGTAEAGTSGGYRPYVQYTYESMPTTEVSGIVSGTTYMIVNAATGKALNGANITTQTSADVPYDTSLFTLNYQSSGRYHIQKYTYDSDSFLTGTTSLSLATGNGTASQDWYLLPQSNGTYQIHNAANENMTIYTGSSSTYVYFGNSNVNNDWLLVPYILNVPLYKQRTGYTCGMACAKMILSSLGVPVIHNPENIAGIVDTEDILYSECVEMADSENESIENEEDRVTYNYLYIITAVTNDHLSQPPFYQNGTYNTPDSFRNILIKNISCGYPVMSNVDLSNQNPYFDYTTNGHYIVYKGIYYDSDLGTYVVVINDPHPVHYKELHIPIAALYSVFTQGGSWLMLPFKTF